MLKENAWDKNQKIDTILDAFEAIDDAQTRASLDAGFSSPGGCANAWRAVLVPPIGRRLTIG